MALSKLVILLLGITLTGCGSILNPYHESFNCRAPADNNGRCIDTQAAYRDAVTHEFDYGLYQDYIGEDDDSLEPADTPPPQRTSPRREAQAARYRLLTEMLAEPKAPLLAPPTMLRVLLLPYQGDGDELFMARHVYIKTKESSWVLTDLYEGKR